MRHLESRLQSACVRWARLQYPVCRTLLFAVPNGYYTTASQARIAKAEGLVSGVADLILLHPSCDDSYAGLCIEMKTAKGRQSENQKIFQQAVKEQGLYYYAVVRSFEEFKDLLTSYLGEPKKEKLLL